MGDMTEIVRATMQHLMLAYGALGASLIVAIPLAIASVYSRKLAAIITLFANLVQAIPSFAVVAIVVPLLGIGFTPAILAIMVRTLLPVIKNTYIGLLSVEPSAVDSARGIGLTEWQILLYIRFPSAYPAMFAGVKFAAILANGIAILTAIIGSGGLGTLVFEGLASFNLSKILAGAIPAIGIALFMDYSFSLLEKRMTPGDL